MIVRDGEGTRIYVGSRVLTSGAELGDVPGTVEAISEPDGDADEDGRARLVPPRVMVLWPDVDERSDLDPYSTWAQHQAYDPDDPLPDVWVCEDLIVQSPA